MICGLAYQFKNQAAGEFHIISTYVISRGLEEGRVRETRVWKFKFPPADGYPKRKAGASETYGLLGGVENERRYLYSEVCERAIGDIVTCAVCEIADASQLKGESTTFIFGPALPKMVGRLSSLHLPREFRVCWLCPTPLPKFLTGTAYDSTIMPSYGESISAEWHDEPLIRSQEKTHLGTSLLVQQLSSNIDSFEVTLPGFGWAMKDIDGTWLPRELLVAAEQVQVFSELGQRERDETQARGKQMLRLSSFCPEAQYSSTSEMRVDHGPPGWDITWSKH